MLDVTDRLIVIIGGGKVAARKVDSLLAAGATRIRVVSPEFSNRLSPGVEQINARYEASYLDGAALVFAATNDPTVNGAIVRDAHARGLLVNRADSNDAEPGDFSTPAVHRDGAVTLTVSAAGSPVLAARLRDQLAPQLNADLVRLADAMRELRPELLNHPAIPESRRPELFRVLASDQAVAALRDGGIAALRSLIQNLAEGKTASAEPPAAAKIEYRHA